jgi:hypothetical protein
MYRDDDQATRVHIEALKHENSALRSVNESLWQDLGLRNMAKYSKPQTTTCALLGALMVLASIAGASFIAENAHAHALSHPNVSRPSEGPLDHWFETSAVSFQQSVHREIEPKSDSSVPPAVTVHYDALVTCVPPAFNGVVLVAWRGVHDAKVHVNAVSPGVRSRVLRRVNRCVNSVATHQGIPTETTLLSAERAIQWVMLPVAPAAHSRRHRHHTR